MSTKAATQPPSTSRARSRQVASRRDGRSQREADRSLRRKRLLTKARKDPSSVLRDRRCAKPEFCLDYFQICDDVALQDPGAAPGYAAIAVELAQKTGDRHLINRSQGVVVHAQIANKQLDRARDLLDDSRVASLSCCSDCRVDWLKRQADLKLESDDGGGALDALEQARQELGPDHSDDNLEFLTSLSHHVNNDPVQAVRHCGRTLRTLPLDAPRGYFLDTVAFSACFLQLRPVRELYVSTLDHLTAFTERIKGLKDWTEVRWRIRWVAAQIHGRLGDRRKAFDLIESPKQGLHKSGPVRYELAVTLDQGILFAQRMNDCNRRAILNRVLRRGLIKNQELDRRLRVLLKEVKKRVSTSDRQALPALAAARCSFVVPVPSLLAEIWLPLREELER